MPAKFRSPFTQSEIILSQGACRSQDNQLAARILFQSENKPTGTEPAIFTLILSFSHGTLFQLKARESSGMGWNFRLEARPHRWSSLHLTLIKFHLHEPRPGYKVIFNHIQLPQYMLCVSLGAKINIILSSVI